MNKVTVTKTELRVAVEKNRLNHRELFLEAIEGYRKKQVEIMERDIARLKAGRSLGGIHYLPVPQDHTRDYDRVLKMIDMHAAETIDVSQEDFAKYVMDDWHWRREFLGTSSAYSEKAAGMLAAEEDEPLG